MKGIKNAKSATYQGSEGSKKLEDDVRKMIRAVLKVNDRVRESRRGVRQIVKN